MALPVTITGISTAVAPVGPFQTYPPTAVVDISPVGATGSSLGAASTNIKLGQTWTHDGSSVVLIKVNCAKFGAPTDNLIAEIYATSGNLPTGSALATATNVVAGPSITTTPGRQDFVFSSVALSNATVYAVVFSRSSGAVDASNFFRITGDNSASTYAGGRAVVYDGTTWSAHGTIFDFQVLVYKASTSPNYYFFGRDGTTATTLQAFKSTAPDTSWSSIATKTGFTTAILNLAAYQQGNVIHLLVQDGTSPTSVATKYVSFDAASDTFLATTETVSAAAALTGQSGIALGLSIVVRSGGEAVAFYNGLQTKTSGTFYSRVYYSRRTAINTWSAGVEVDALPADDAGGPEAVLGTSDAVHFIWKQTAVLAQRTLSSANALQTASTNLTTVSTSPNRSSISYDNAGTIKIVAASITNIARFDSSNTPTLSQIAFSNATAPGRLFNDGTTVYYVYRFATDSDLYLAASTDDGASFGTATNIFTGTVASSLLNCSVDGTVFQRGSNVVIPYIVNDNGTLKYNERTLRSVGGVNYTDTITPSALDIVGQTITGVYVGSVAYDDTITASSVPIGGSTIVPVYTVNYTDTITPSMLPIGGATLADILAFVDTIITSSVPITGQTITPIYTISYTDTITASVIPIGGATIAPIYTIRYVDTITASSIPIDGQTITAVYSAKYSDTIVAGAVPIVGQAITDVFVGHIDYVDSITASSVPISGGTVTPVYTARYSDTITASAIPIDGQTIVPVYTARYSDTIIAGVLPIGGSTIVPVYTARYSDTLAAGVLPITGQTITPVFSAGAIDYGDVILTSSVPISGSTIAPVYTARYSDSITASSVPIGGASLADVFARSDAIIVSGVPIGGSVLADVFARSDSLAAGSIPIVGSTITPIYTARFTDTITTGALPITGQVITPIWSAGSVGYSDVIAAGGIPIVGQTITPALMLHYSDTISSGALPIIGATIVPTHVAHYNDTIAASSIPITGQTINPVFYHPAVSGATSVKVGGVWLPAITHVKTGGIWYPATTHVKSGGVWNQL